MRVMIGLTICLKTGFLRSYSDMTGKNEQSTSLNGFMSTVPALFHLNPRFKSSQIQALFWGKNGPDVIHPFD